MDYDEIINRKKTVRRRMDESGADETDSEPAVKKKVPVKPAAEPAAAEPSSAPKFTTGPRVLTPEEQAKRIEQFRALQSKQRKAQII